jgi:hypothetical protein
MKSEVKTNFPNSEDQEFFALGLAGRPFEGSWGVRLRRFLGFSSPAAVSADSLDRALR